MEPGRIGIVARSPNLAREVERTLPTFGLGASKVVDLSAIGQQGVTHLELLKMFSKHRGTDAILLLGPVACDEEEACTAWIATHKSKPVIGFIDETDPEHAQQERLRACGVHMSPTAEGVAELTASLVESPWLPFD
jgi:succinyl-CoA synthetase alpha subunit